MIRVLCIDDKWREEGLDKLFAAEMEEFGIKIFFEADPAKAVSSICRDPKIDVVLLDLKLPDDPAQGQQVLKEIKQINPELPTIVLTGIGDANVAEECCVELGAAFYFVKDEFSPKQLIIAVRNAAKLAAKVREAKQLRESVGSRVESTKIIGASRATKRVLEQIQDVCQFRNTTVLIGGERGVGKDLVAQTIHRNTEGRGDEQFVRILCSAVPENLFESELFGVIPNYPGFHSAQGLMGKIREANRGTLFLDEIGDMPPSIQGKILVVLERKSFRPVGGARDISADIRIIAATNQPLEERVKEGRFRPDLFDRLQVYAIFVPPLRERQEDIPALAAHFVELFNHEQNHHIRGIEDRALEVLCRQEWLGNVRELRNTVERAFVNSISDGANVLTASHFAQMECVGTETITTSESQLINQLIDDAYAGKVSLKDIPRKYQRAVVEKVLLREKGIGVRAAEVLGLTAQALRRKLSIWGISTLAYRKRL